MANPKSEIRNPKRASPVSSGFASPGSETSWWRALKDPPTRVLVAFVGGSFRARHHLVTKPPGCSANLNQPDTYAGASCAAAWRRFLVRPGISTGARPGLFERLVERKENEIAIDRFDEEYQELITFASLEDLAEIIEFNNDLAKLLTAIAPRKTTIAGRLREIEILRLKLEAAISFDDGDIDRYSRVPPRLPGGAGARDDRKPAMRPPPRYRHQRPKPEEPPAEDVDIDVTEVDELRAEDVEPALEDDIAVAEVDHSVSSGQTIDSEEALEAERAMVAKDDVEVLRVLHREVMSVAEAVYQRDVDRTHPVWETLISRGWYDLKKADMELAPMEHFYSVAEEARKRQRAGADLDELKAYLEEAEFTKLLLELREMFMRHHL